MSTGDGLKYTNSSVRVWGDLAAAGELAESYTLSHWYAAIKRPRNKESHAG